MNQLLAKIRNRKQSIKDGFKKIIDNKNCYSFPIDIQTIEYNPNTLLEDGQWYSISEFSCQEFCLELLKQDSFNSVDYSTLEKNEFAKIDYLCSYQDENYFYFQKIRPSQLLYKKRLLFGFGQNFTYDENNASIVINSYPDAIYKKDDDTLYFQKLETISTIFKGIDVLYKEATEEETVEFLKNDFISVSESLEVSKIGKSSRKRIAMAMTTLSKFSDDEKLEIFEYIKQNSGLGQENNAFIIKDEDDIKKLVWGITERYYETPVSKEKRIANSIIDVNTGTIENNEM